MIGYGTSTPRRRTGHSPKWQRLYTGPYLVIDQIGPVNFIIQKSARADPLVVHSDKLKLCESDTPTSWLVPGTATAGSDKVEVDGWAAQLESGVVDDVETHETLSGKRDTDENSGSPETLRPNRTGRMCRRPAWAGDYVM